MPYVSRPQWINRIYGRVVIDLDDSLSSIRQPKLSLNTDVYISENGPKGVLCDMTTILV